MLFSGLQDLDPRSPEALKIAADRDVDPSLFTLYVGNVGFQCGPNDPHEYIGFSLQLLPS